MEIDLPASGLSTLGYPYMFPSPPTPSSPSHVQQAASQGAGLTPLSSNTNLQSPSSPTTGLISFQKAEEQSWFYYLSEIALRRIQNRVLHAFYRDGPHTWSRNNIFDMARSAASFEMQLEAWYVTTPPYALVCLTLIPLMLYQAAFSSRAHTIQRPRGSRA
jgi:hypothetical protein